jgi:hypothetical protein
MSYKVERNVPVPSRGVSKYSELGALLRQMEVGDSVFVADAPPRRIRAMCGMMSKRDNKRFVTRTVTENEITGLRVWRVALSRLDRRM